MRAKTDDDIRKKIEESISMLRMAQDQISVSCDTNSFVSKEDVFPIDKKYNQRFIKNIVFIRNFLPMMKNISYKYHRQLPGNKMVDKFLYINKNGKKKTFKGLPTLFRFFKAGDPRFGSLICDIYDMIIQSMKDHLGPQRFREEKKFEMIERQIIQDIKTKSCTLYKRALPEERDILDYIFEHKYANLTQESNLNHVHQPKVNQILFQPKKKFTAAEINFIEHFQNCFVDGFLGFIDDGLSCDDILCNILKCNLNDLNDKFHMDENTALLSYKMIDVEYKCDVLEDIWIALVSTLC